ncbi:MULTISPECIES: uroporphyrinogen-III C-methyltransferase [Sphingobium]|jgi:uroporphyrin-III C-methyltransferase|uniref:uroporphyrinogen-III C-methyltransferase n=1 Tax=Sphingobium yanoikuyae TaxID=13690 RepID=A0A0J9D4W9_SPHYA|nr:MULTISPECIES: uroporphyrinogen-III C-methyltransferase [Sphingobium]ATP19544.1 uroporphyrinogen-III C-methyltransferase [Sphingobium yanoikuyae]KMW32527.1 uroporphyrin-III methyltransferase [Sphingobium yanoikuyae]TKV44446.1 uroporphyrin-III methyltransferase [Sphingobium sp. MP9-4]
MQPNDLIAPGDVWLVGAGPGDPDLLTRKAERLIRAADIIFHDALVGPGILDLISDHAERVSVGKRSGRHSKDQQTIDEMLVEAALAGKRVVRLKGGDPAMFARSTEEMTALRAVGVRVRICPGITAASAVAASAGISLSLRGIARRVQFVTAHSRRGQALDLDWDALADPACTLAVYMGREAAPELSRALIAAGLPGATPALITCDASLPQEQQLRTRLDLLPLVTQAFADDRPTLILIGEAVAQADMAMAGGTEDVRRSMLSR